VKKYWTESIRNYVSQISPAGWVALSVTLLGLLLRIEHAYTFNGPDRGSDYGSNVEGVRWMLKNMRPFNFTNEVAWSVKYQPPLWSAVGALVLKLTNSERAIAYVAVFGWTIRQWLLARIMKLMAPHRDWSAVVALSINAVLPISVLTDGKVNPENYHTTLFTVALYFLWRMERQSLSSSGVSLVTAMFFGLFAGLSMLAKGTASILVMAAVIVLVWQARRIRLQYSWAIVRRRLLAPTAVAAVVWCVVTGWWIWPNLVRFHHPFPHTWDTDTPKQEPTLALPFFYRRPLGWALPFEWKEYIELPINRDGKRPRPNFWATSVAGTYTDWYNRGFCRLPGGPATTDVWGGWPVTMRCVGVYVKLFWLGILLSIMAVVAFGHTLRNHIKTCGRKGSLVLPTLIVLGTLFPGLFAIAYPYDHAAVLNPRYLLPISVPMAACLGLALGQINSAPWKRILAHSVVLAVIACVAILVVYERFGT
jgi:hypothetical protein